MSEEPTELRVALIGNPNTGKTSLFNALTGMRQRVGNYSGVTVEKKIGKWALNRDQDVHLIDLSLIHTSEPTRRYAIPFAVFSLKKKNLVL